jgi:hypothetical protein
LRFITAPPSVAARGRARGVMGKLVDANPAHQPSAGGVFANRCELLAVPLHELRMPAMAKDRCAGREFGME